MIGIARPVEGREGLLDLLGGATRTSLPSGPVFRRKSASADVAVRGTSFPYSIISILSSIPVVLFHTSILLSGSGVIVQ